MSDSIAQPTEVKMDKLGKYDKYEIESCADCLIRAEEIKADKEKMKEVSKLLKKKGKGVKKAVESLDDLRDMAYEKEDDE